MGGGTATGGAAGGGADSGGVGGGTVCEPGTTAGCYSGPPATQGVGTCHGGLATCDEAGSGWEPCAGEVTPDAENCATPDDEDCNGVAESCNPGAIAWAKKFGNGTSQASGGDGRAIATDALGNIVLGALVVGPIDFGGGLLPSASYIAAARLDAEGNHVWSRSFGEQVSDGRIGGVAAASDGSSWLVGSFRGTLDFGGALLSTSGMNNNAFVAKLDGQGNHLWSARYGEGVAYGSAVAIDSNGAVLVAGSFGGSADFGGDPLVSAGDTDIFVVKLTAQGGHVWSKRFGSPNTENVEEAAVDAAGNVVVGGFYNDLDLGGGPLPVPPGSANASYVVKLDPDGNHIWSHGYVRTSGINVATGPGNEVVFAGIMEATVDFGGGPLIHAGGNDLVVVKLTSAGAHTWSRSFGDGGNQGATGVTIDGAGNILLAAFLADSGSINLGGSSLFGAGAFDIVLAKLDPDGNHIFSMRTGDADAQLPWAIACDPSGSFVATGKFGGTIDFGDGPLTAGAGGSDMFVVKLQP